MFSKEILPPRPVSKTVVFGLLFRCKALPGRASADDGRLPKPAVGLADPGLDCCCCRDRADDGLIFKHGSFDFDLI